MNQLRRLLVMTILCASGGTIFNLPYLSEVFYKPLQHALALSKTQLGTLPAVFGVVALISYFPGGWLADRVSPRKLITLAMIATGLGGFYFATFPSYPLALALHAFWGVSITLVFWNAMIKATRNWAPSKEQGRAFGILEAGRGLFDVIPTSILLALFAWLGSTDAALSTTIVWYSTLNVVLGLAAWWVLDDSAPAEAADPQQLKPKVGWKEVTSVLKMPAVWLMAVVIMATNSAYWGTYYFTPYASEVFLMSVAMAGLLSVGRMWVKPFAALASGFIADRFGIARTVTFCLLLTTISFALFAMTPSSLFLLPLVIVNVAVAAIGVFALRGIYWALLDEGGVPIALTGTAAGMASAIGLVSDIYMPLISGVLLDTYPGLPGYRLLFAGIVAICAVGILAAWLILRLNRQVNR